MNIKNILTSFAAVVLLTASAVAADLVNTAGASRVALSGYDPVAFFTDAKPMNGDPGINAGFQGATYFFVSKEHKKMFEANPAKYAPQTGGFCAYGVSVGALFPVDISTWQIRDGKH